METKKVIKTLLELRDELYLNEQITMNGVWKLNGVISKIITGKCQQTDI